MRYYYSAEDYDAMGTYDAGREDVETTIEKIEMEHPTMTCDKDSVTYLTYQSGSSNKFHCFVLAQDKSGNWFAFNGAARIGYSPRLHRIYGPASVEQCRRAMNKKITQKERKGYTNYFGTQKWYLTAETYGAEMDYMELPVIPDSYGTDSATEMGGRGVPVWYGSAEWKETDGSYVYDEEVVIPAKNCNHCGEVCYVEAVEPHYWDDICSHVEVTYVCECGVAPMNKKYDAEGMEMTPDIEGYPGLPVVPDSYGTNSALESGQGVPVWYGSAEETNPECGFCGSEEAYSSQYGTFCIPCATIVGEIVETHFTPGRRNPAGMIPRYSKDAEGANPSGGSTGNQVVSWESGGLSSPSGPPSDIFWSEMGRGSKWSEADAAHALLRRKSKKQRTIDRKKARRQKYSAEGERIRNAGELVDYVDVVMNGKVFIEKPFTLPPYLEELMSQDKAEIMTSQDEMDILFRDGSMASCIYDARNNTLNTFVVAYGGDEEYNSETIDSHDWDKTEYEKKDLEIVKPFGTAMKATMGVAAGTAAILGIMVALTKLGGNNE